MDYSNFPAHIRQYPDGAVQSVKEHCTQTAKYAAESLNDVSLSAVAYLSGLLHDLGKMTDEFRSYLEKAVYQKVAPARGSVNHTFAGVRFILENFHLQEENDDNDSENKLLTAELIAFAIGAHHGLFDCVDQNHCSGYKHRIRKDGISYDEAVNNYLANCVKKETLTEWFHIAVGEIETVVRHLIEISKRDENGSEAMFYVGLLTRLITSAVIDGDRRDTAEFMNYISETVPNAKENKSKFWYEILSRIEAKISEMPNESEIDQARHIISYRCSESAEKAGGLFRLFVPTGGGKTISSLRFAVKHAAKWSKSRIIFISPLLSILEQNASVIREYVQNDDIILEHHSNVVRNDEETGEKLDLSEFLADRWSAPVIITTLVQFLNTLFSGKTTCVRRFQALCNSVIVIDEVQTIPNNMLTLFNLTINFLTEICKATVVLCSATQPCLERTEHPLLRVPEDIVPYDPNLWSVFKRTDLTDTGGMLLEEIPDFAGQILNDADNLLIVCNKKSEAETLFRAFSNHDVLCFHLSASMCVAHRRTTLKELKTALKNSRCGGEKVVCISTQVIEAGVDISFARVIRFTAGMDSMVQAAGRCNRNSERALPVPVYLVQCKDEKLFNLKEIQRGKNATAELLAEYRQDPRRFANDLMSDSAIEYYYRRLYEAMPKEYQDFTVRKDGKTLSIFSLLSTNEAFASPDFCTDGDEYFLNQAFKTAGEAFSVFDNNSDDVIVPYGEGKNIISEICSADMRTDYDQISKLVKKARAYTVSVYDWQKRKLMEENGIISLMNGKIHVLREEYYSNETGLTLNNETMEFMEV